MNKIVKQRSILPSYLFVQQAAKIGDHPKALGGFADVWEGDMEGLAVAIKVLRINGQPEDPETILRVCHDITGSDTYKLAIEIGILHRSYGLAIIQAQEYMSVLRNMC